MAMFMASLSYKVTLYPLLTCVLSNLDVSVNTIAVLLYCFIAVTKPGNLAGGGAPHCWRAPMASQRLHSHKLDRARQQWQAAALKRHQSLESCP